MLQETHSARCRVASLLIRMLLCVLQSVIQVPGDPFCVLQNPVPAHQDAVLQFADCEPACSSLDLHVAERRPGPSGCRSALCRTPPRRPGCRSASCRTPSRRPGTPSCTLQSALPSVRDTALQPAARHPSARGHRPALCRAPPGAYGGCAPDRPVILRARGGTRTPTPVGTGT
jgi:hypothetical protein